MRYLRAMILVSICTFGTPVFADLCCPSGCSPSGYGNACWYNSTNNSCGTGWTCQGPTSRTGGGVSGPGSPPPATGGFAPCFGLGVIGAELVKKCMSELSGNAQFFHCFFFLENSADRAEDYRTGLSCPARQAKLAKQCQARCSDFAANFQVCSDPNSQWQRFFGDIGGLTFGSARVELCGPRLASGFRPFPSYRDRGWNNR